MTWYYICLFLICRKSLSDVIWPGHIRHRCVEPLGEYLQRPCLGLCSVQPAYCCLGRCHAMDIDFPEYTTTLLKSIRKHRKKLRQIEHLEVLKRPLAADEQDKVFLKNDVRAELQYLLTEYENIIKSDDKELKTDVKSANENKDDSDMKRCHNESSHINRSDDTEEEHNEVEQNNQNELIQLGDESLPEKVARVDAGITPSAPPLDKISTDDRHVTAEASSYSGSRQESCDNGKSKDLKKKLWRNVKFQVNFLSGHSDLVLSVDCDGSYIISTSRDTTVKIWEVETCKEIRSLRGHTGAVTCASLLSPDESKAYLSQFPISPAEKNHRILITGSTDCSVRIWSIDDGKEVHSIYTYNGVSSVGYVPSMKAIVSGTDGGKLELWDAVTGYNHHSVHLEHEEIKCIKVVDTYIYTGTTDCVLKVHCVRDNQLCTLHETEMEFINTPHNLMALAVHNNDVYCGDDHPNIKVISWKSGKGHLNKLRNVKSGYGTSDAICVTSNHLISSSYDLDTGNVSLNVRELPSRKYLYTLRDYESDIGRILSIAVIEDSATDGVIKVLSAGQSLCLWTIHTNKPEGEENYIKAEFDKELTKAAVDSDNENEAEEQHSDGETSSDEEDSNVVCEEGQNSWFNWCSIL